MQPRSRRVPGKRCGIAPRSGASSKIRRTKGQPPSAKRQWNHCAHGYERNEDGVCTRKKRIRPRTFLPSNGCIFLSRPLSLRPCLIRLPNNYRKTDNGLAPPSGEHAICCKACLCVPVAGMLIMANRLVQARKQHERSYAYYRCIGSDAYRFGGVRLCWNKQLRTDLVDEAVWEEVCRLLSHPERLEQEYRRRLLQQEQTPDELSSLETRMGRVRQGIARLIDSYAEGLIDKTEFEPRMTRMRERLQHMEAHAQQARDEASLERELTLILGRLDAFATRVKTGLHEADWLTRREIIRALVKRVEIDQEQVRVVFRVNPPPPAPQPPSEKDVQSLQHCRGRDRCSLG